MGILAGVSVRQRRWIRCWLSSLLVTVVWLIGMHNAFNLIDGVDGLASGVGLFATATMLIAALLQHNWFSHGHRSLAERCSGFCVQL